MVNFTLPLSLPLALSFFRRETLEPNCQPSLKRRCLPVLGFETKHNPSVPVPNNFVSVCGVGSRFARPRDRTTFTLVILKETSFSMSGSRETTIRLRLQINTCNNRGTLCRTSYSEGKSFRKFRWWEELVSGCRSYRESFERGKKRYVKKIEFGVIRFTRSIG